MQLAGFLVSFENQVLKRAHKNFSFVNGRYRLLFNRSHKGSHLEVSSIGNYFLSAAQGFFRSLPSAIFLFSSITNSQVPSCFLSLSIPAYASLGEYPPSHHNESHGYYCGRTSQISIPALPTQSLILYRLFQRRMANDSSVNAKFHTPSPSALVSVSHLTPAHPPTHWTVHFRPVGMFYSSQHPRTIMSL